MSKVQANGFARGLDQLLTETRLNLVYDGDIIGLLGKEGFVPLNQFLEDNGLVFGNLFGDLTTNEIEP